MMEEYCTRCEEDPSVVDGLCKACYAERLECERCSSDYWPDESASDELCGYCLSELMFTDPKYDADRYIGVYGLRYCY